MSLFIQGDIKMALNSLRTTRWRSILTMLGVVIGGPTNTSTLIAADQQTVQNVKNVKYAVPLSLVPGSVQADGQTFSNASVVGTSENIPEVLNQTFQYGNSFGSAEGVNAAILGQNIANRLFPGEVPLGHSFTFHGQTFIIRGELNSFDSAPLSLDVDFNNSIF